MSEARLQIADMTIAIISKTSGPDIGLDAGLREFSVQDVTPDLSIEACWQNLDNCTKGQLVFDSGGAWKLYLKDDCFWFHCSAPALGEIPYKVARLDPDFSRGHVYLHQPFFEIGKPVYPLQYPLDELLILNLLSQGRGAEVHACGIVDTDNNGYLFVGQSGAGKTTMARLWAEDPGIRVLSDDRIILRWDRAQLWMYGTPWHGEAVFASAARAPLKQIYFISHGDKNSLNSMSGAESAASLFTCSFPVFYSSGGLKFTIDFYGSVANAIPCNKLSVVPNREVIAFIRRNQ
jgi:hypothetical protein